MLRMCVCCMIPLMANLYILIINLMISKCNKKNLKICCCCFSKLDQSIKKCWMNSFKSADGIVSMKSIYNIYYTCILFKNRLLNWQFYFACHMLDSFELTSDCTVYWMSNIESVDYWCSNILIFPMYLFVIHFYRLSSFRDDVY